MGATSWIKNKCEMDEMGVCNIIIYWIPCLDCVSLFSRMPMYNHRMEGVSHDMDIEWYLLMHNYLMHYVIGLFIALSLNLCNVNLRPSNLQKTCVKLVHNAFSFPFLFFSFISFYFWGWGEGNNTLHLKLHVTHGRTPRTVFMSMMHSGNNFGQ